MREIYSHRGMKSIPKEARARLTFLAKRATLGPVNKQHHKSTGRCDASTPKHEMDVAIVNAKAYLSSLPDDWDDDGGVRVPDCTLRFMEHLLRELGDVPMPKINPGPNLTVDICWNEPGLDLLVNVTPKGEISFYGERSNGGATMYVKGNEPLHLQRWKEKLQPFLR